MDENTVSTETTETTAVESADSYWPDDVSDIIAEVQGDDSDAEPSSTEDEAPQTKDAEAKAGAGEETAAEDTGAEAEGEPEVKEPEPETFTLKHLDETRTVGRDEVVALAQKGMDYDRMRGKYDDVNARLKEIDDWFSEYTSGKDFNTFRDDVEAARLAQQRGIDKATALERIKLDRERKALEADRQNAAKADGEKEAQRQRVAEDVRLFSERFPEVAAKLTTDKNAIPQSVWDAVGKGERLVDAYEKHQAAEATKALEQRIKELEAQVKAKEQEKQNTKNAERSTGSAKSDGDDPTIDLIAAGWNSV